jgi:hypothetical protein
MENPAGLGRERACFLYTDVQIEDPAGFRSSESLLFVYRCVNGESSGFRSW